jgi:hypothetical protein
MECEVSFIVLIFASFAGARLSGQQFNIAWHSIDGGGGTSAGGVYRLSATIGQPDAGQMSGGNYSLTGGFWSVPVTQTPAPALAVERLATGGLRVFWAAPAIDWVLDETPDLTTDVATPWTHVAFPVPNQLHTHFGDHPTHGQLQGLSVAQAVSWGCRHPADSDGPSAIFYTTSNVGRYL